MNKPNKQTVLPLRSIPKMYSTLPVTKVKGLGGKLGEKICETFKIKTMGQLAVVPRDTLVKKFEEKNGNWLFWLSKGIDLESVMPRFTSKSIGCCKRFPGVSSITGYATLQHWLTELATEICERLAKDVAENNRIARQMVVSYTQAIGNEDISSSRTVPLVCFNAPEPIVNDALDVIRRNTVQFFKAENQGCLNNPIKFLGLSVGKFEDKPDNSKRNVIQELFDKQKKPLEEAETSKSEKKIEPPKRSSLETMIAKMREKLQNENVQHKEEKIENFKHTDEEETTKNNIDSEQNTTNVVAFDDTRIDAEEQNGITAENSNSSTDNLEIKTAIEEDNESMHESFDEGKLLAKICQESDDSCEPEDYKKTYAEFSETEVRYITCNMCKQQIPQHEVQEHADFHVALKVSQQQRVDFRSQLKMNVKAQPKKGESQNKANAKSQPASKRSHDKCRTLDFFLRKDDTTPIDIETIKCPECFKNILITEVSEHQDYHVAKKIQINLNRSDMVSVSGNKKRRLSESKDSKSGKVKPLTQFFSKR